ncbi:MAG: cytochrome c-type biogenesis protein CcmH [Hyphomicrobiales bacterium]|nr:cytochrome c-type biogenesis protein CcmH [Hyphomicrobiales bacterium]
MSPRFAALTLAFLLAAPLAARAVQPDEMLTDPKLESRAREISVGIRCMVCQNENIDDSDAPLAKDLRLLVRDRLKKGDTDQQVRDYLVARYGDFVLLKPPFQRDTLLLWLTPALVLIGAAGYTISRMRTKKPAEAAALSDAEKQAVARLAAADDGAHAPVTKA